MRKFNKILSFIIVIILVIGISFFIYTIWITPASKASTPRVVINYEDKELKEKDKPLYIKIDSTTEESNTKVSKKNIQATSVYSEEWVKEFNRKIEQLQQEFPKGSYWNHIGASYDENSVTTTPCNHGAGIYRCNIYNSKSTIACGLSIGGQCAGFASMLSDRIFGKDAPVRIFYNYDDIRVGDQARIDNNGHTVFIIEKTDDYVIVAECNADYNSCVINWGRKIPRSKLNGYYITRWQ
jgi:hypothetical protein